MTCGKHVFLLIKKMEWWYLLIKPNIAGRPLFWHFALVSQTRFHSIYTYISLAPKPKPKLAFPSSKNRLLVPHQHNQSQSADKFQTNQSKIPLLRTVKKNEELVIFQQPFFSFTLSSSPLLLRHSLPYAAQWPPCFFPDHDGWKNWPRRISNQEMGRRCL